MQVNFYQMYLDELEEILPITKSEEDAIIQSILSGDYKGRSRLIEGYLKKALEYAKLYENQGLSMEDLVQEANMALTIAIGEYKQGDLEAHIQTVIKNALEEAISIQSKEYKAEEEIAARVNVLKDISQMMAEELGREATLEELAQKMKMTEEEIKDIMKVTLDVISLNRE